MKEDKFSYDSKKKVLTHIHIEADDLLSPKNNEKRGSYKSENTRKFNGIESIKEYVMILERGIKSAEAQLNQFNEQIKHIKSQKEDSNQVLTQSKELLIMVKRQVPGEVLKEEETEVKETDQVESKTEE